MGVQASAGAGLLPVSAERLHQAHARLLHDPTFQFAFAPDRKPTPTPGWIIALGKLISALAPFFKVLIWALLAVGVLLVIVFLVREFVLFRQAPGRARPAHLLEREDWRPTSARAKALLEDADRLAAQGRFAEAAHVLLSRSIQDIQARRPQLIVPSLTSRDIAGLRELPAPATSAFTLIARHVERSLFGGRDLDAAAFAECRRAYEAFAFPAVWTGARA
jgi:hypothetical protein